MNGESMTDTNGSVDYRREGAIAFITLNRPRRLNAFNDSFALALDDALRRFDEDPDALVAILHGEGRAFSSGADVKERHLRDVGELERLGGAEGRGASAHGLLYKQVNWKPIIAAAHGYAVGLGLALLLEGDISVAAADTQLQVTEIPRGLWGTRFVALMTERGGGVFADEVVLTGRFFTGQEAADRNIITRAAPPGAHLDVAVEYAKAIAANPPLAVRAVVRARRWHMQKFEAEDPLIRAGFPLHLTREFHDSARAFVSRKASPAG